MVSAPLVTSSSAGEHKGFPRLPYSPMGLMPRGCKKSPILVPKETKGCEI